MQLKTGTQQKKKINDTKSWSLSQTKTKRERVQITNVRSAKWDITTNVTYI